VPQLRNGVAAASVTRCSLAARAGVGQQESQDDYPASVRSLATFLAANDMPGHVDDVTTEGTRALMSSGPQQGAGEVARPSPPGTARQSAQVGLQLAPGRGFWLSRPREPKNSSFPDPWIRCHRLRHPHRRAGQQPGTGQGWPTTLPQRRPRWRTAARAAQRAHAESCAHPPLDN